VWQPTAHNPLDFITIDAVLFLGVTLLHCVVTWKKSTAYSKDYFLYVTVT